MLETLVLFLGQEVPQNTPVFLGPHVGVEDRKNSKEDSLLERACSCWGGDISPLAVYSSCGWTNNKIDKRWKPS